MYTINPWLIGALIICATILAFAAIYFDYVVEKKSIDANKANETNKTANSSECRLSKKIIKVHRNYIVGFLGFGVIMLLTARFGGAGQGVFTYLSFASTITSLVLSILAIFVTVHSSADLYKQFTRIDSAASVINIASDNMSKSLNAIEKANNSLQKNSDEITKQLNEFSNEIMRRFDKSEELMQGMYGLFSDTGFVSKSDDEKVDSIHVDDQPYTQNSTGTESIVSNSSLFGICAIYACVLSHEKDLPFSPSNLFSEAKMQYYFMGYIIALKSFGFAVFDTKIQFSNQIICKKINCTKDEIITSIKKKIKEIKKPNTRDVFLRIANSINDYFYEDHIVIDEEEE